MAGWLRADASGTVFRGGKFVRMIQRHMKRKAKYPDEGPATGMPYKGIENRRSESEAAVHELFS
jgi:arylsulfatase